MYDVFPLKSFYCYSCKAVALYRFFLLQEQFETLPSTLTSRQMLIVT